MGDFSHYTKDGRSEMVDISGKQATRRSARARGFVRMSGETIGLIQKKLLPKGNPFEVARIAGILAAKKTSDLIPLCHPLNLSYIDVALEVDLSESGVIITSEIILEDKTGAEMEALVAVSVAALTVYDMCKAVDKGITIEGIYLIEKKGGKSSKSVI